MAKIETAVTNICDRCGGPAGKGGNYFKEIRKDFREYRISNIMFFEMCDDCFDEVIKFAKKKE